VKESSEIVEPEISENNENPVESKMPMSPSIEYLDDEDEDEDDYEDEDDEFNDEQLPTNVQSRPTNIPTSISTIRLLKENRTR
jgi:hypothetical protein